MAFGNSPSAKSLARRAKNEQIFCVGWRAFVNWPERPGQPLGPVPLTDLSGEVVANDFADGQEVEIVSWRPRAREGLSYQIRRITDGSEWWIPAICLRRQRQASPPAPPNTSSNESR